jgi:hypothetical protein
LYLLVFTEKKKILCKKKNVVLLSLYALCVQVCGINMRNATHEHAVTVLRQCGDNLTMKVQYNPESKLSYYFIAFDVDGFCCGSDLAQWS